MAVEGKWLITVCVLLHVIYIHRHTSNHANIPRSHVHRPRLSFAAKL